MADPWLIIGNGYIGGGIRQCSNSLTADVVEGADFLIGNKGEGLDLVFEQNQFAGVLWTAPPVQSAVRVVENIKRWAIPNVLVLSSGRIYGKRQNEGMTEKHIVNPDTVEAQRWAWLERVFAQLSPQNNPIVKTNLTKIRLFNVAGFNPFNNHYPRANAIAKIIAAQQVDFNFKIRGTTACSPIRDYVHVVDATKIITWTMALMEQGNNYGLFNYGSFQPASVVDVVRTCNSVMDKPVKVKWDRPASPLFLYPSPGVYQEHFKFKPMFTLEQIIQDQYENFNTLAQT